MAGKAETFLNKMDETAAGVLNEPTGSSSRHGHHQVESNSHRTDPTGSGVHSRSSSISSSFSTISTRELATNNGAHEKKSDDDEKLFEFLNSSASTPRSRTPPKTEISPVKENLAANVEQALGGDQLDGEKDKIKSMTKEISSLTKHNIQLETDCKRLKKKVDSFQMQFEKAENELRELEV